MTQEIIPDKQTVESCLKQKTYYVDFYQREYVWSKDTVETLLKDIFYSFDLSYNEHKDEDLTAEVLEQYNWYYLNVFITNKVEGKVYIVDGQQRLTTLTLIATKLYHITDNENLKDTLKECIFTKDKFKGNVFCIDNDKRKNVMQCILDGNIYDQDYLNKTEETLVNRYNDISKDIDERNMPIEKINAFIYYFLDRLVLVELAIEKDDTPMVFEVINDRGESLKPFEILKGKMIGLLSKNDTESFSNKWDTALGNVADYEDIFFADYIKSKFVFKRNAKQESAINNSYHHYIFDVNNVAKSLSFRKTDKQHIKRIKDFINTDLTYYTKLYSKIRNNENVYLSYDNIINGLSGQYQNIMSACVVNDVEEDAKIECIAKEFDRLWILLILNGIYDSNEFQEITFNLNEKLTGKNVSEYRNIFNSIIVAKINEKRNTNSNNVSVLDYSYFLRKNYSNMNTRSLRYIFARIEKYICDNTNQAMQNDVEYIATKTGYKTGYHIEHILSHNDTNRNYFNSDEEFEEERDLLGGLLLLKGADNICSGNEEYEDKLKTYSNGLVWGHSLCSDFYHANKDFDLFNKTILQQYYISFLPYSKFNKETLKERSKLLYHLIKIIWEVE